MKTKIKIKTAAGFIGISFSMLIFYILPVEAMSNPASEYCVSVGGTLEIRTQEGGGQYGVCVFEDGSECEEWALYNGECQKGLIKDGEEKDEIEKNRIKNLEEIQKTYQRLNLLSQQPIEIKPAEAMAEVDQTVSPNDLGVKKSDGILQSLTAGIFSGLTQESESSVGILPDSKLYPLKNFWRRIQMAFTFNPVKKVELQEKFTNEKFIEAVKTFGKNKDTQQVGELLEKYSQEAQLTLEKAEKIKENAVSQEEIDNLIDTLIDHLIKRQKAIEDLKEELIDKLTPEQYEKVEKALDKAIEHLGKVIEKLEKNRERLKERFETIAQRQEGSDFKNFKNLEVLKEIEEKMPSEAKEVIKEVRENIAEKFTQEMSQMEPEKRALFKNYISETKSSPINSLEVIKEIEIKEIPPEVRLELEKAKQETIQKIEEKMEELKFTQQKENFLQTLKEPKIEKLRVLEELESKLSPEISDEIREIKEESIKKIQEIIENNYGEQGEFIEELEEFHDVQQFEILNEIKNKAGDWIRNIINQAENKVYLELQEDLEKTDYEENKRKVIEKLITDQPKHIEVLTSVQTKLEEKLPSQSNAPETLERVINMQIEKINRWLENTESETEIDEFEEQINENQEIREVINSKIPEFEERIEERKELIREYQQIIIENEENNKVACITLYDPVCGVDGKTYSNECFAKIAGVEVSYKGECGTQFEENCSKEGETPGINGCCEGLVSKGAAIVSSSGECLYMRHLVCLECGDGICSAEENKCNCPEDCRGEEKSIIINSPNGGEEWQAGNTYNITWGWKGLFNSVGLTLKQNHKPILSIGTVPNTGSYSWKIPYKLSGFDYTIQIVNMDDYSIYDESDNYFVIKVNGTTCAEKCKSQGYASGICRTWPVYPGSEDCKTNEENIGTTSDCFVEQGILGVGKGCCCYKELIPVILQPSTEVNVKLEVGGDNLIKY